MILDTVVGTLTVSNLTSIEKQRHCERGSKSKGLYQSKKKKMVECYIKPILPWDSQFGLIKRAFDVPGIAIPRLSTQRHTEPTHCVVS